MQKNNNFVSGQRRSDNNRILYVHYPCGGGGDGGGGGPNSTRALPVVSFAPSTGTHHPGTHDIVSYRQPAGSVASTACAMWSKVWIVVCLVAAVATGTVLTQLYLRPRTSPATTLARPAIPSFKCPSPQPLLLLTLSLHGRF